MLHVVGAGCSCVDVSDTSLGAGMKAVAAASIFKMLHGMCQALQANITPKQTQAIHMLIEHIQT